MGTTSTALRTQTGVVWCYVLAIEGYDQLITDWQDLGAVATAWSGSGWTDVLPGLVVGGGFSQAVRPWQTDMGVMTVRLAVKADDADTFGKAVAFVKPTFVTRLTDSFLPAADGSGTINVKATGGADASGDVFIGGQKYTYGSKAAGSFSVGVAGSNVHSPFTADGGNTFAGPMTHPGNVNFDVGPSPLVTNAPTDWIGRRLALYIHRVVDGVLDVKAQAQLEFAGKIRTVGDDESGFTVLDCEDFRGAVRDALILKDQWTGYVKQGIRLAAGTRFHVYEVNRENTSAEFEVVASGASGDYQMDEGLYELEELGSRLNAWLAADKIAGTLDADWDVSFGGDAGKRTTITFSIAVPNAGRFHFHCTSLEVLDFLGFTDPLTWVDAGTAWRYVVGEDTHDGSAQAVGDRAPYRAKFIQEHRFGTLSDVTVELDTHDGTFFNQRDYLPPILRFITTATESWGVFLVGKGVFLGRMDDATHISGLAQYIGPLKDVDSPDDEDEEDGITFDDEKDKLAVRQVLLLAGSFTDVVTKLVASLGGTAGVNHTDYDVLPWGAGIPWSLLGDNWLDSCTALEQSTNSKSITMLVTEPTRLMDLIASELAMRLAWVIWKDEGYQLRTLPTPNSLTADHILDETNKATPVGTDASERTATRVTNEFLTNVVNLKYGRTPDGKYRKNLRVVEPGSFSRYGEKLATVEAVNSFGQQARTGSSVEELAHSILSRVLPVFSKPLKTMRRSLAPTFFHATPGDTASVSDLYARDPTSGARGFDDRAAIVIGVSYDRGAGGGKGGARGGKMTGEVELLIADEDRHYPMAPAAEIDTSYSGTLSGRTFTNGYAASAAGGPAIRLKAHAYSRSTDAEDVTRFAAGDKLRIPRLDGAVSGDAWSRTVASVVAADRVLALTADIASPAYTASAAELYRVQYREYSACTADQRLHAFQADDADGLIEDLAQPNTYGEQQWEAFAAATVTALPNLPVAAEAWGDGKPFHPGLLHDISLFNNILPAYRTAPDMPLMLSTPAVTNAIAVYTPLFCVPFFLGPVATAGLVRKLRLAPFFKTNNAANTATVRVTSSAVPPKADSAGGGLAFSGPTQSVIFTTTSTSFLEAAEQALTPVRSDDMTWLTVEMKATDATEVTSVHGLSRLYVGPPEAF